MPSDRLIDVQLDLIIRFDATLTNLKKEGKERRTETRLKQYEAERVLLQNKIRENNKQLIEAEAPHSYIEEFKKFETINNNYKETLKLFNKDIGIDYLPTEDVNLEPTEDQRFTPDEKLRDDLEKAKKRLAELEKELSVHKSSGTKAKIPQTESDQQFNLNDKRNTAQHSENFKMDVLESILLKLTENTIKRKDSPMKPPNIQVPIYDGDITQFHYFKEAMERVLRNVEWGNIEKFVFLREHLAGDPLNMIKMILMDDNASEKAWGILDKHYDSQRRLLSHNIKLITNKKFQSLGNDDESLKNFTQTYEAVRANFSQIKVTADQILAEMVISRLDGTTASRFEDFIGLTQITPTLNQISDFLMQENIKRQIQITRSVTDSKSKPSKQNISRVHVTQEIEDKNLVKSCFICKSSHELFECPAFITSPNKIELLKHNKLCIFCGKHRYDRRNVCRSREFLKCEICKGKHATQLHVEKTTNLPQNTSPPSTENSIQTLVAQQSSRTCSLMPTAIVKVVLTKYQTIPVRVLIDQCAERSYISESLTNSLGLKTFKSAELVRGINNITTQASKYTKFTIKFDDSILEELEVNAIVLPEIAGKIPSTYINNKAPVNVTLADPTYGIPGKVEILLGNDVSYKVFKHNSPIKVTKTGLVYQSTHFGWVISGRTPSSDSSLKEISIFVTQSENNLKLNKDAELSRKLHEFYELPENDAIDEEADEYCENLYKSKHYRLQNGRYVVPIPWKQDPPVLGESYYSTRGSFLSQESKWLKDPIHYIKSNDFMLEYFKMGHMTLVDESDQRKSNSPDVCYIPYISIVRHDAYTTKLRNVFNASSKTKTGVSLNDTMHQGRKLQNKIFNILTKCRNFKFIYNADIAKMFRQIMILPRDQDKLRIIWRHSPLAPVNEFRLATVTYGTDAAPWQAIRTIHQCANDNAPSQEIAEIIKSSFYVDDLLHGAHTIKECQNQIEEITTTMNAGKFPLTKWMSNNDTILDNIPLEKRLSDYIENNDDPIKLLGLLYDHSADLFSINVKIPSEIIYTKRGIASIAASFYDPLGLILPFIMLMRIFLRNIWAENVDWDEPLNDDICETFRKYLTNISILRSIKISRWMGTNAEINYVEFIGFADASKDAQAAIIYSRVKIENKYLINLIAAKGNVNKLKSIEVISSKQQTIPKLELEAIVTLTNLYNDVRKNFTHLNHSFWAYTDSQIALAWVRNNKVQQKFIRRKIQKIHNVIQPEQLNYVNTTENPADAASRGQTAEQLFKNDFYYNGPKWLQNDELPKTPSTELKHSNNQTSCFITRKHTRIHEDMFDRFSNFMLLMKIVVLILRWREYKKSSSKKIYERYVSSINAKLYFRFSSEEITQAKMKIIKYYQQLHLGEILKKLQANLPNSVPRGHWLYKLSPILDDHGLIRIGGRMNYADIPDDLRHPIAVPESNLKTLIISYTHANHLHAGNSLMLRIINQHYWIPRLRSSIHHFIQSCVVCTRWTNRRLQPEMSQLPTVRVNKAYPFENCGVDLAGPFQIKSSPLKKAVMIKVWIVTFICMLTKALHLELVTSLDTEHFLAAFDRFTSRRCVPTQVWSDNGKNFIGTNRMLNESWIKISKECQSILAVREIKWIFIPRYSPSFGGIWEASVKSIKYFTHRVRDVKNFTFEEFTTLLCKVEALLNSRPITSNPTSPFEDEPLTPFHFLTNRGIAHNAITAQGPNQSPLKRKWLEILQIQTHLWKRFQSEYLHQMQKKSKWLKKDRELKEEELVLIDDHNTAPGEWKKGKIVKLYKDQQGVSRKVDVQNSEGKIITESVRNLIPLNIIEADEVPKPPTRTQKISVTQVLLTWLALTPSVNAFNLTILPTGVHLININKVYIKATDLNLIIETQLNTTNDISLIKNSVTELDRLCGTLENIPTLKFYCLNITEELQIRADATISEIMNINGIHVREKRWGAWLGIVAKHLPMAVITTGVMYQQYEIHDLNKQNELLKERVRKSSMILLNITEIEHDELDKKLTEVIKKQQEVNMIGEINDYLTISLLLIDTIMERQNNIINMKPYKELNAEYEKIKQETPNVILPPVDDIFTLAKKQITSTEFNKMKITFKIPLVYQEPVSHYGIVNIPDEEGFIIDFEIKQYFFDIILNQNNSSYFIPTTEAKIMDNIYDIMEWAKVSDCISILFQLNNSMDTCNKTHLPITTDKIYNIKENVDLILATEDIKVNCENRQAVYNTTAAIVSYPNCSIRVGSKISTNINIHVNLTQHELQEVAHPNITLSIFKPNRTQVDDLIKELEEIENIDESPTKMNWNIITIALVISLLIFVVIIFVFISGILHCKRRAFKEEQSWHGPEADISHKGPITEISLEIMPKYQNICPAEFV